MNRPGARASKGSERAVAIVFASVLGSAIVVALVIGYFTWCPRFGHGGLTDEQQIVALVTADSSGSEVPRIYVVRGHALAAWSMLADGSRHEELFERRFCHWRSVATSDTGFQQADLRSLGVPKRDANILYVRLMEGYAEGL